MSEIEPVHTHHHFHHHRHPCHHHLIFVISYTQTRLINPEFYTQKQLNTPQKAKHTLEKVKHMKFVCDPCYYVIIIVIIVAIIVVFITIIIIIIT